MGEFLLIAIKSILTFFKNLFRSDHSIRLENNLLKHQLALFKQRKIKPEISYSDRIFWIIVYKLFLSWQSALMFVTPETIIKWHRKGFKYYWKRISNKNKSTGRPWKNKKIRDLIHMIAFQNTCWAFQINQLF